MAMKSTAMRTATIGLVARCPVFDFDPTSPHLDTSISLDADTVHAGESFSGTVEFFNPGTELVHYPYNGSVQVALLFAAGTDTPVAVGGRNSGLSIPAWRGRPVLVEGV